MRHIVITGGAGFIGSALVRRLLTEHHDVSITVYDAFTYAASFASLRGLPRPIQVVQEDVCDAVQMAHALQGAWGVVHLAAETHVDRSIHNAGAFVRTNVLGTYTVLEAARQAGVQRVLVQSTDEVYGPTPADVAGCAEDEPFRPSSPYAASKAAADLLAQSYHRTHGLPVVIARPTNTIGPRQHPEKMVPLFLTNALCGLSLPLYGDGRQERDRMHVADHVIVLDLLLHEGAPGQAYNVAAGNYRTNAQVAQDIVTALPGSRIQRVPDRPGHDHAYRLNTEQLRALGWAPQWDYQNTLLHTTEWYQRNEDWWQPLVAEMAAWRQTQYGGTAAAPRV